MPRRKTPSEIKRIESTVAKYVGEKLRHYRIKARYTLKEASKRTRIPVTTLSEYERGYYPTPIDRLKKLAALYQAPLSELQLNPNRPIEDDAEMIAEEIRHWPTEEREVVVRAILQYLKNLQELSKS